MAIGFPRMGGDWAVSKGHFSARQGRELIFAMPVGEGNSGGPLVKDGKVVALVTSEGQGKAFAVAAASVGLFLDGSGIEINRGGTDQSIRIADKIPSPAGASNFKGEWRGLHPGFDPRFNLSGSTGILTYSPDQKFQKGIEVLRVRSVSGNTFSGEVMCSDGKFYEVKGTLRADGKLFLAVEPGSGCGDSLWERYVAPAAEPAIVHDSKNQAGQVTDLLEGKDGSTTATGPRQGATGAGPSVSARDDCALPVEREGLSGIDAAMGLGATTEYARYQAIYSMARGKQLRIPLCAGESATILRGTTGNNRALAIAEIALVVKIDLSGDEAALILGTTQESNEYARYQAIYSLAQAKKFKVGLGGEDAKRVLDGTTGNNRALAIAELALVVKSELSGDEAALILGSVQESNEYARYQGIYSLARAKKFKARLGGADLQRILDGTSGNNRVLAVSELSQAR